MKGKTTTLDSTVISQRLKAIRPSGTNFGYCINCYDGCQHGCLYCYGRKIRWKDYKAWINAIPRLKIVDLLQEDIKHITNEVEPDIKDIFVCSVCDAYQPIELEHKITRNVIQILRENNLPFTVLTKSANVLRDIDLFVGYNKCRVGLTIITLDDNFRGILEPNASPIAERCEALQILKASGISTYCSVEPIMCCEESNPIQIIEALREYVDLFEFGKLTPYPKMGIPVKYDVQWYARMFRDLIPYCKQERINYCFASHSKKFLESLGLQFTPYPLVSDRPSPEKS
jgi:DNA repair photolyase